MTKTGREQGPHKNRNVKIGTRYGILFLVNRRSHLFISGVPAKRSAGQPQAKTSES